jgi:hypothetical protein
MESGTENDPGAVNAAMPRTRPRQPLHTYSVLFGFMVGIAYYATASSIAYLATEGLAKLSANFGPWADVTARLIVLFSVVAAGWYTRIF